MNRFQNPRLSIPSLAALAIAAATLGGCYYEGGPLRSNDQHTYVSTPHRPTTLSLRDTRTSEILWTADVPVGEKLVVRFYPDRGEKNSPMPDLMEWDLMKPDDYFGTLENQINVPPSTGRRLEVSYRAVPELPENMNPPVRVEPASDSGN